jgi:hypothetical protein
MWRDRLRQRWFRSSAVGEWLTFTDHFKVLTINGTIPEATRRRYILEGRRRFQPSP